MLEDDVAAEAIVRLRPLIAELREQLHWPDACVRVGAVMSDVLLSLGCSPETAAAELDYDVIAELGAWWSALAVGESCERGRRPDQASADGEATA